MESKNEMTPTLLPLASKKKPVGSKKPSKGSKENSKAIATTGEVKQVVGRQKSQRIQAIGRRKSALAQVKLTKPGWGKLTINSKPGNQYLQNKKVLMVMLKAPLRFSQHRQRIYDLNITVTGGGFVSQTQAIQLGIARALSLCENSNTRKLLKAAGFLTCDSRVKERKKYGLKKARKSPQFSKR